MRLNRAIKTQPVFTHGGSLGKNISVEEALRRSVLSCLLWEREFYEDGQSIADRIEELALKVQPKVLADLAVEARSVYNLRHVPLLLLSVLVQTGTGKMVSDAIVATIQRADELSELLAVYWRKGRKPLSNPLKKGLARAFLKFDEHQLAKYNRDGAIKLRDVLFLCHAKPENTARRRLFERLAHNTLAVPDTWEVALSAGGDKKATFERLIREGQLGYLALLRNLRNMEQAGVSRDLMKDAILARGNGARRVLPFRYVAAARVVPSLERYLDQAMLASLGEGPSAKGRTIILVDVSGSMRSNISGKSDLTRMDAAATLASMFAGDEVRLFTFSSRTVEVPHRMGMAGVDAIINSQPHGNTNLAEAVALVNKLAHDRLIVITDEQSTSYSRVPNPVAEKAYMINVASYRNGIGYGAWTHIDGFSESVLRYIYETEASGDEIGAPAKPKRKHKAILTRVKKAAPKKKPRKQLTKKR